MSTGLQRIQRLTEELVQLLVVVHRQRWLVKGTGSQLLRALLQWRVRARCVLERLMLQGETEFYQS